MGVAAKAAIGAGKAAQGQNGCRNRRLVLHGGFPLSMSTGIAVECVPGLRLSRRPGGELLASSIKAGPIHSMVCEAVWKHIAAGRLGVASPIEPLATEHAQPLGIDAIDHAADGGQKIAPAHITQGSADGVQRGDGQLIAGMQGAGQADGGQLGMGRAIAASRRWHCWPGQRASVGRHDPALPTAGCRALIRIGKAQWLHADSGHRCRSKVLSRDMEASSSGQQSMRADLAGNMLLLNSASADGVVERKGHRTTFVQLLLHQTLAKVAQSMAFSCLPLPYCAVMDQRSAQLLIRIDSRWRGGNACCRFGKAFHNRTVGGAQEGGRPAASRRSNWLDARIALPYR